MGFWDPPEEEKVVYVMGVKFSNQTARARSVRWLGRKIRNALFAMCRWFGDSPNKSESGEA